MNKLLNKYKIPLLLFLDWRMVLFVIAEISHFFIKMGTDFLGNEFERGTLIYQLWVWANFDGAHYLSIVKLGYGQFEYAFFPGFPGLIWLISKIIPDPLLVSLLLGNIVAGIFFIVLYKLWILDFPKATVLKGILLLLAFPTTFYLGAVYSEGLFVALVVGAFWAARKNKWWLAGLLGIGAASTRLVGIMLVPALFILWYQQKQDLKKLLPVLLIGLGLLGVLGFNYYQTGDALYFFHVQPMFGAQRSGGQIILLPQIIFRYMKIFVTANPWSLTYLVAVEEFVLTSLAFLVLIFSWKKINLAYWVFCLGVLLIPTFTGTLLSMPRFILAGFPLFIVGANLVKNKYVLGVLIFFFFLWQILNLVMFINGYWIS